MDDTKFELVDLSRQAWDRLRARLDGLDDDEYVWEPVADCWNIRRGGDGVFRRDWSLFGADPAPVTTIAWRVAHITDLLSEERCATWLGLVPETPDDLTGEPDAERAIARLERANALWERYLAAVPEADLSQPVGAIGHGYANRTRAAFVLHIVDELIHHGAEVGLLRDLYRAMHAPPSTDEPVVLALLRADADVLDRAMRDDDTLLHRVRVDHPDLVAHAAAEGRWAGVRLLVELGFDVNATGRRTALHDAAGIGDIDMVRFLVDHGADTQAIDADFNVTPRRFAEFFNMRDVIEVLRAAE